MAIPLDADVRIEISGELLTSCERKVVARSTSVFGFNKVIRWPVVDVQALRLDVKLEVGG